MKPQPFEISGPLPRGTTLLEASAGTGKTWTIGALVARYVAEGHARLDELLVITFGRAATQELRERVREHLRSVAEAVEAPEVPTSDPVVALLRNGPVAEVTERARRLRAALTTFDAATIATTHQFCQLVLRGLGVAGDTDQDASLVEDLGDLLEEVVDDLYVRGFAGSVGAPSFDRAEAGQIALAVTQDPHATIVAPPLPPGSGDARKTGFALAVRREFAERKARLGVLGFDDLLSGLNTALAGEASPARARMRERWKIVLVDEFQDTDPVQWQILRRAFHGHATLVLIGDPKQAIYAFRGGDVVTYLHASSAAADHQTLPDNHRSDPGLVRALQATLGGAQLGDPQIVVHPVTAALVGERLTGAPHPSPFRLRVLTSTEVTGGDPHATVPIRHLRSRVAKDVAADISALLASGANFDGAPLAAGHIAVLAHTRAQLDAVRHALRRAGIRSVIAGGESVFDSAAATDWIVLLDAIEASHRPERVRAAALTPFFGYGPVELDQGGDALTDELSRTLLSWSDLVTRRGIAAVVAAAEARGMTGEVLTSPDGTRRLTDLRHIGELLHARTVVQHDGVSALAGWLRERVRERHTEERTRRLDSDAAAVHLVTIHTSKGLQYPVVYAPFLADRFVHPQPQTLSFHDPGPERERMLDIGISADGGSEQRLQWHRAEDDGESLRLAYVALTRAQSQVVAWWFPHDLNTPRAPLHRLLFGRGPGEGPMADRVPLPGDPMPQLLLWEAAGGPTVEVVGASLPVPPPQPLAPDRLTARSFSRSIDEQWRRTSYSALTRVADEAADLVGSEPESEPKTDDEGTTAALPEVPQRHPEAAATPSPMATLPVGATFGSLVHAVLEHADLGATDLQSELLTRIREQRPWWPVADLDEGTLAAALDAVCHTPLGPLAGDLTLARAGQDRLCELTFELPLGRSVQRGVAAGRDPLLGDLAPVLRTYLPEGDPVRGYAEALEQPELGGQALRGYLTGSIDVTLRAGERYLVVDYKTNWLGPPDEPLTAAHYDKTALDAAMGHSSYPLQALLYVVVLHRYLRWRLPDYDPERHLGGVLYLYLRGMCGPQTPLVDGQPCGVFSWRPPVALVTALSDLLDTGGQP